MIWKYDEQEAKMKLAKQATMFMVGIPFQIKLNKVLRSPPPVRQKETWKRKNEVAQTNLFDYRVSQLIVKEGLIDKKNDLFFLCTLFLVGFLFIIVLCLVGYENMVMMESIGAFNAFNMFLFNALVVSMKIMVKFL